MRPTTRDRLLTLNRRFYERVAESFHETRRNPQPGLLRAVDFLPSPAQRPLRLLDVGCGNGRFARILNDQAIACDYLGVDGSAALLDHARAEAPGWTHVTATFAQADLAQPGWGQRLTKRPFGAVTCFATLHHLPSRSLRQRVVSELAAQLADDAPLILSFWQFLDDARLASKRLPWASVGLGVNPGVNPGADDAILDELEPGDALLPWQQTDAVRYAHHVDEAEARALAQAAGLHVVDCYYADGKSGRLGLYLVLKREA